MNLAQMRTIVNEADQVITHFAAGNDAFDLDRERGKQFTLVNELGLMNPMPWTAFEFSFKGELHTYVLDQDGRVIGHQAERRR